MDSILLQTKLNIPLPQPNLVLRPHLLQRLEEGRSHRKLTLICAPAGFGKTTLVVEWLRQLNIQSVWLSIDSGDNEPSRFLSYLIAALNTHHAQIGQEALAYLRAPQPPSLESLLSVLINELAVIPNQLLIVLDDYHEIQDETIHAAAAFFVEHLPPQLHLVVTSRVQPSLPLARLRARGQLTEIDASDLRFSVDEASQFLNEQMGLVLSREDVARLEERTEGWAAGLQFAALGMQRLSSQEEIQRFIGELSGRDRHVVDYLLAEVLERLSPELVHFLLCTSILPRVNAALSEVVTGQPHGQETLERLERNNLFIIPLDSQRNWYRYHHLFAQLLRHRLQQQISPQEIKQLHRQVSDWFACHNLMDDAIDQAFAAQDVDRAAQLMEPLASQTLWGRGAVTRLWHWLDQLPTGVLHHHPKLTLAALHSYLLTIEVEGITKYLNILLTIPDLAPSISAQLCSIQALMVEAQGQRSEGERLAQEALALLPEDDLEAKAIVLFQAHIVLERNQSIASIQPWMVEAIDAAKATDNHYVTGFIMRFFAWIAFARGELHHVYELAQEALQFADSHGSQALPATGFAHYSLGDLYFEWNELDKAAEHYAKGLAIGEQTRISDLTVVGYIYQSRELVRQGEIQEAERLLTRMKRFVQELELSRVMADLARLEADLALRRVDLPVVERWVQQNNLSVASVQPSLEFESDWAVLIRYLIAASEADGDQHRLQGLPELLQQQLEQAKAMEYIHSFIWYSILQSLTHRLLGQDDLALEAMGRALSHARPGGYIRSFLFFGQATQALIEQIHVRETFPTYTKQLLDAFDAENAFQANLRETESIVAETQAITDEQPLFEPLTERELEVLQLVTDGLKNHEIADQLIISIGTVKRHVSNIYGKLGVTHRAAAIARAKDLQLSL